MKPLMFAYAVLGMLFATGAQAGWETTEWGMTPQQVAAAAGDAAVPVQRPYKDRQGDMVIANSGEYAIGPDRLKSRFYYEQDRLVMIGMSLDRKHCASLVNSLQARYGAPLRISDQVILKLIIWHEAATNTRIRLLVSTSICDLYFEPRDRYLAVDTAAPG